MAHGLIDHNFTTMSHRVTKMFTNYLIAQKKKVSTVSSHGATELCKTWKMQDLKNGGLNRRSEKCRTKSMAWRYLILMYA